MRNPLVIPALLLGTALARGLLAQDVATTGKSDQLVIKTAEASLARNVLRGAGEDPPALKEGEHYVLTMDETGAWACATATGKVGFVSLFARPALLMETFADEVEQARSIAKAAASMGAADSPMSPKDLAAMMDLMFDFPAQLATVSIVVERDQDRGYDAHAELVPGAQSRLASAVAQLKSSGKGAPELAGEAAMAFAADIDPACLALLVEPMNQVLMGMMPAESRESATKLMAESWALMDGTAAFTMRAAQMHMLFGCTDERKLHELMLSERWTRFQGDMLASMPGAEMKVTREKLGDLDVLKTAGDLGQDNPMFPDGKMSGYSCVTGGMLVSVLNIGKEAFADLVTRVASGKVKRAPLADGALLTFRIRMADLIAMNPDAPEVEPGVFPAVIDVRVGKKDKATLKIGVRVEM